MKKLHARLAALVVAALSPFGAAQAQLHGGNPFGNNSAGGPGFGGLFRLDTETGVILEQFDVVPNAGGAITGVNSLTIDPTTGLYYAVLKQTAVTGRVLATIDVATGAATIVGNLGDNFSSISFREDGQLFGVTGDGATVPETLFTIDKATAATTLARTLGNGADGELIAHHPGDNAFYHWSGNGTIVFERIDDQPPYNVTGVPVIGPTSGESFGAVWDACRQRFLVHDIGSAMSLWTTGGVVSDRQAGTVQDVRGLALVGANACDVDLAVTAVGSAPEPTAGDPITVTFDIANAGPARARNTVLTLTPGTTLAAPVTANCTEDPAGVPTCSLGVLLGGDTRQVTLSGTFGTAGLVSGVASTDSDDTDAGNDEARALFGPVATVAPASGLSTSETGTQDTVFVALNHAPLADVTIPVTAGNPDEGGTAPAALVFTALNWNVAQPVTVTGVNDDVDDGPQPFAVLLGPSASADTAFDARDVPDASGTNDDDDVAGIQVTAAQTPLLTSERGDTASFDVRLASEPVADVSLPVASNNPVEGNTSAALLVFTAANWDVPQSVTLTGADDALDDGTIDYAVEFGQATSADPNYDGLTATAIAARNVDDEGQSDAGSVRFDALCGVEVSEAGGSAVLRVVREGNLPVTVRVATTDGSATSPADFTAVDQVLAWGLLDEGTRDVTIALADDGIDDPGETFLVTLSQPTGGVQLGAPAQVLVTIRNGVLFGNGFEVAGCPP